MERKLALIALFAGLIAALGLIPKLDLVFGVPITAQSLGIMLCWTILGSKRGGLAVLLFLALVALGLPLLSGGRGGLGVFASPTVGFLVGWPIAAFVIGVIVEKWRAPVTWVSAIASVIGGILILYLFGAIGMAAVLEKSFLSSLTLLAVFVPGDLIKAGIAGGLTGAVARWRPNSLLSRL